MQKNWQLLKFSSVGLEMVVATIIGWAIGHWLDLELGTAPWLTLVFLLFGVGAGFKGLFRSVREAQVAMGDRPGPGPGGGSSPGGSGDKSPQGPAETPTPNRDSKE